jgi:hypothetical protein
VRSSTPSVEMVKLLVKYGCIVNPCCISCDFCDLCLLLKFIYDTTMVPVANLTSLSSVDV